MSIGSVSEQYNEKEERVVITCNYFQSVQAKALRGQYRLSGKYNVGFYHGMFIEENRFLSAVEFATWFGHRWKTSERIRFSEKFMDNVQNTGMTILDRVADKGEEDIGTRVALGQSMALTYRYEWGAQFSIGDSAKVIVPTTPEGIRELFNDRDKPEDADRRAALRHWVSQHRRRKTGASFASVREHMRGATKFQWRGFDVTIRPSAYDEERNLVK